MHQPVDHIMKYCSSYCAMMDTMMMMSLEGSIDQTAYLASGALQCEKLLADQTPHLSVMIRCA